MPDLTLPEPSTVAVGLAVALVLVVAWSLWRAHVRAVRRALRRRTAGYQLMDCLKAYSAWVDWHRDEPLLHQNPEDLTLPAALAQACMLKDEWLPELSPLMVQLLHSHRELMQFFWEENILRMTQAAQRPYYADPRYHALRDRQDAALDSLFARCRGLIGDTEARWHRTRSDFTFSSGLSLPSHPSMPG
jgi:hypothetical protein